MGAGPAGELTFADIRARLACLTDRVADTDAGHDDQAAAVAAARLPPDPEPAPDVGLQLDR